LASLVNQAEREIKQVRHWGVLPYQIEIQDEKPTPKSDLDTLAALIVACAREVSHSQIRPSLKFGSPMVESHIHIMNDEKLLNAFERLEAAARVFGHGHMMPATQEVVPVADNDNLAQRPADNSNAVKL